MSALEKTLAAYPPPSLRGTAWLIIALVLGLLAVSATTTVDRIATAPGAVAPRGQVRIVQHLEGGVAKEVLVREGDRVTAGQPLMRLDLGADALSEEEIQVRLDALTIERARLLAEISQLSFALPKALEARRPELAAAEEATFRSRRREYESSQKLLEDRVSQKELEVQSFAARLKAARSRLGPLREQFEMAQQLRAARLATRSVALKLDHEVKTLEGEIEDLEIGLPLARAALSEERERRMVERNRFRRDAAERLREVEIEIARQQDLMTRAAEQTARTVIAAPIAGVVKTMRVNTVGGVVRAGEPIAEIVPSEERLVVEARLAPEDIGHVAKGQAASVKLETYDYLRYGALSGRIAQIAADASQDAEGRPFFRVVVETDAPALEAGGRRYPISAGMNATVDVKLGRRSILEFLVAPVLKLRAEAFRDR